MSPVDRAGSLTEMKLVSVHMVTFSPLIHRQPKLASLQKAVENLNAL